jgi:predicted nucleotide-binding protein
MVTETAENGCSVIRVDFKNKKKIYSYTQDNSTKSTEKNKQKNSKTTGMNIQNKEIFSQEHTEESAKNALASLLLSLEEDGWDSENPHILDYVEEEFENLKYVLNIVSKLSEKNG